MREVVQRFAVLKALSEFVKGELDTYKQTVVEAFADEGVKSATPMLPDGSKLGTLTMTEPKPKRSRPEGIEWVQQYIPVAVRHIPEETIPAHDDVDMSLVSAFLDSLIVVEGEFCTKDGGLVEGVTVKQGDPYPSMRFSDEGKEALARAWGDGSLPKMLGDGS